MSKKIVITGIGIISPLGLDTKTTWKSLLAGQSGVKTITSFDPGPFETKIAAEITDFDPVSYIGLKESRRMDRFVQLALTASIEALEQANLSTLSNPDRTAVIVSSGIGGINTISEQLGVLSDKGPSRISPFLVPMMLADIASAQISMRFGAKGTNFAPLSACSSAADAIGISADILLSGAADIVITGGTEAAICPIGIAGFNACKALSKRNDEPEKASRPFDLNRDGFVMGEGASILVMETIDSAKSRNADILAEFAGYGSTADAFHLTQPALEGRGGAAAMQLALNKANLKPSEIDYINAHGTSTKLNDSRETEAMKLVFGTDIESIPISSTKSMTGHLLGASGALEAAISVLSIINGVLPPTINLETPDPECDLDYIPYVPRRGKVTTAMSNSFGFGGHNASLIFKQNNL